MKTLTLRLYEKIRNAVKSSGTYNPEANMLYFEEDLIGKEYEVIYRFLAWCFDKKKTFGSGNYQQVFQEFLKIGYKTETTKKVTQEKYKEGEKFFEITFELPIRKGDKEEKVASEMITLLPEARNVKVIPCEIYKEDYPRLSVSKAELNYTVWRPKEKSQILEKAKK